MDWGSFNQHAKGSFNQNARGSYNQSSNNQSSNNQSAYNQNAAGNHPPPGGGPDGPAWMGSTGAGGPSGAGFVGGYGPVARSDYATPASLGPVSWALDFPAGNGWPAFPSAQRYKPYGSDGALQWQTGDWDPGLRFWTLDFDPRLTEWLQDLDLASPAVMAARELAGNGQHTLWWANAETPSEIQRLIEPENLKWRVSRADADGAAWISIKLELQELEDLMQVERSSHLDEAAGQSTSVSDYFLHFMGIDAAAKPWTVELMGCASALCNLVSMQYKAHYRRVRPSTLHPGLVPPWGPPQHPAFPSGHSMLAHFMALLLLEIEPLAQRFGVFAPNADVGTKPSWQDWKAKKYGQDMQCPLLWLAWRIAKNRERIGVHYPSDSSASRSVAGGLWQAIFPSLNADGTSQVDLPRLVVPTLKGVLVRARAEWPPLREPLPAAPVARTPPAAPAVQQTDAGPAAA